MRAVLEAHHQFAVLLYKRVILAKDEAAFVAILCSVVLSLGIDISQLEVYALSGLGIPMMSISHSDLMPISAERSDAGLSQCETMIGIRQEFC